MAEEPEDLGPVSAYFPVVFFDGDREIDIGSVTVHPSMGFKKFQAVISQRIGFPPHQISLSLVRRKKARVSPEVRRKVPIDEASDFAALALERDCFVLAVLRRSRRERRARPRKKGRVSDAEDAKAYVAQEMKILKRNNSGAAAAAGPRGAIDPAIMELWEYEAERIWTRQRLREKYLLSVAAAEAAPYLPLSAAPRAAAAACEECEAAKAEDRPTGFHWCVNDAVTVGFRSAVGPIERPSKKEFEASWADKTALLPFFPLFL